MENLIFISIEKEELENIIKNAVKSELTIHLLKAPEEKDDDRLIKIDEAARMLNVSQVTIHKWKSLGLIPFHKLNRRLYFKKCDILKSLRSIDLSKNKNF